jgi:hypothetical protein
MVRPAHASHKLSAFTLQVQHSGRKNYHPLSRRLRSSAGILILVILRASPASEIFDEKKRPVCVDDFPGVDPGATAVLGSARLCHRSAV